MTLKEFVARYGVTMTVRRAENNPHMTDMGPGARHWKCSLKCGAEVFTVPFSQGSAHTSEPTVEDVLDCWASECAAFDGAADFEDWADEFGYDTDSRQAEKLYNTCKKQSYELFRLLGATAYNTLLEGVERQ
jgi:hypothetical protein